MNRIQKIAIETENIAREHGHDPHTTYVGASFNKKRRFASTICTRCSAHAMLRSHPPGGERDILGTLTQTNCNVATLISEAAEAVEIHGEDELEKHAARACANLIPAARCQEFQHRYLHE